MTSAWPHINRWRAFALLAVSYFMTIIDLTIVNVSLPTIGRDLHFSQTNLQWVVTAYALTFGGLLLLGGRAADLLGRRRILMFGLALFTTASLACGLATGDAFLIGARAVQGVGAAIMLPAALSIVMNMFEEGAERNKALGVWGGLGAAGDQTNGRAGRTEPAPDAERPVPLGALLEHVHHDRQGGRQHDRRAHSLHGPGADQERVACREPARQGGDREQRQPQHQDPAAAE